MDQPKMGARMGAANAKRWGVAAVGAALLATLVACTTNEAGMDKAAPSGPRMSALPPIVAPVTNPSTPAKEALGKQLFVDKRLSASGTMACQSCHYRNLGWTDAQMFSRRDDGKLNTIHTPSLYNVGHQSIWYWDGRAATLEGQITAAWRGQMSGDPAKMAVALNAVPGYATQFQAVFGGEATGERIAQALAAYLRTKNSENSPWDQYEMGKTKAVSADAVAGYNLFMGKGRCVSCHTPPHFGNSTFFNIGLEGSKEKPLPGRFNVTKDESDRGAFKTPSLRSSALGAPYFHDGSAATLEAAVRYMATGGGVDKDKTPIMTPTGMTDGEIKQVVAFIESLTSAEPWEPPTLPK